MRKPDATASTQSSGLPIKSLPKNNKPVRTVAESVVQTISSWQFVLGQSIVLFICTGLSIYFSFRTWNPLPFIILNLILSLQATLTTPVILIVQNKQNEHDKKVSYAAYYLNSVTLKRLRDLSAKVDKLTPP